MGASFTQFKEESPIIRDVPVASGNEGTKDLAEVFGHVARGVGEEILKKKQEHQEAEILHESNRISEIGINAKVAIAENPANAAAIAKNAKAQADFILSNSDPKYRDKLQSYYDSHIGGVEVEAARTNRQQALLRANASWYSELPLALKNLDTINDPEEFHREATRLMKMNDQLMIQGAVPPKAHANTAKTISLIAMRNEEKFKRLASGDVSARDVHYLNGHTFTNDTTNAQNLPMDENTAHIQQHYEVEMTAQSAYADADAGIMPLPQLNSGKLSDKEYMQALLRYDGAVKGQSLINSNSFYPYMLHRMNELGTQANRSYTDQGELAYLTEVKKKIDNGQSLEIYLGSSQGSNIFHEWNQKKAAIMATTYPGTKEQSEAAKARELNMNDIQFSQNVQAGMTAMGIPVENQNILMPDKVVPIKTSFTQGADPALAVNALYKLPRNMQYWGAKALENNTQRAALYGVAGLRNSLPDNVPAPQDAYDMIRYAQDKQDFSALKYGENGDKTITNLVRSKLADLTSYIHLVPEGTKASGGDWNSGIISLGELWVKNKMKENNDLDGRNINKYADDFKRVYSKGFNLYQGSSFTYNMNEVSFNQREGEAIAYSMLHEVYQEAQQHASEGKIINAMDMLSLHVTNTRDGSVAVVDPTGHVIKTQFVTPKFIAHSVNAMKVNQEEISKEIELEVKQKPLGLWTI